MILQRDIIVAAALKLLNEVGMDGLSTRKLAEQLNIKSASLYWHFRNKRDLLDAMSAAMFEPAFKTIAPTRDWRVWLTLKARTFRTSLLAYRDGARVHSGSRPSESDFPDEEKGLEFLCQQGFSAADAMRVQVSLSYFVIGWVLEEQAAAADNVSVAKPDPKLFPYLTQALSAFQQNNPDQDFEFGLQALILGFDALRKIAEH